MYCSLAGSDIPVSHSILRLTGIDCLTNVCFCYSISIEFLNNFRSGNQKSPLVMCKSFYWKEHFEAKFLAINLPQKNIKPVVFSY